MNPRRFFKKSALRVVEQGSSGNATSSVVTNAIDARTMSASELLSELKNHGCKDISDDIDLGSFTGKYDCGGGNTISYGSLRNGTKVFIEMTTRLTPPWQSDLHFGHPKVVAQELRAWSECNHPNVLGLLGLTISQERLGVVLSSVTNGNLVEYLIHRQCVNRYRLSVQICDGLVHLHEHAIIHGHLSGVNVYISHDGTPMLSLRLIHKHQTFGLTRKWLVGDCSSCGPADLSSASVQAPELIGKAEAGDKATDVYALGMTILETLTIYPPRKWHNVSYKHYYIDQKKRVPDRPEEFIPASSDGDRLWDTLVSCWSDQPERRPSA